MSSVFLDKKVQIMVMCNAARWTKDNTMYARESPLPTSRAKVELHAFFIRINSIRISRLKSLENVRIS